MGSGGGGGQLREVSEVLMARPAGSPRCACGCMGLGWHGLLWVIILSLWGRLHGEWGGGGGAEVSEVLMAWPALGHHAELVGKAAWDLEEG